MKHLIETAFGFAWLVAVRHCESPSEVAIVTLIIILVAAVFHWDQIPS